MNREVCEHFVPTDLPCEDCQREAGPPCKHLLWHPGTEPPPVQNGSWSKEVVAVTDRGRVYALAYYLGHDGGTWQRPNLFAKGEYVVWWAEMPPLP